MICKKGFIKAVMSRCQKTAILTAQNSTKIVGRSPENTSKTASFSIDNI